MEEEEEEMKIYKLRAAEKLQTGKSTHFSSLSEISKELVAVEQRRLVSGQRQNRCLKCPAAADKSSACEQLN
ncbi:hypothetical protein SAY87_014548 [Trapa incisa]|uniref:Uncharacterized protein n=1 Tax=Trapa incisa TaxID=236973 RepID=A0AAN7GWB3_9MYRT|nr:hypothetical protein SAY87_014548 [Trapa incisa]